MNKEADTEKEAKLSALKEEYNLIMSKKHILKEHNEIIKEIFVTVKNQLELDPFVTEKLKLKTGKKNEGCCRIY